MLWPKLQFSLRGLALAVLVTGVVLSHAVTSRRLASTQQDLASTQKELSQLRRQHGPMAVHDPTKLQIRQVSSVIEPYTWEWELYLPDARDYKIHVATRDIPAGGFPAAGQLVAENKRLNRPGTRTVRVALRKDPHGRWLVLCDGLYGNIRYPIDEEDTAWLESRYLPPSFMNPAPNPEPFDKPFELIRLRESSVIPRPASLPPPATEKGLLIWLEP